jgi:glycosyltransferase involved in cell wall biosynthesis
MKPLPSLSIVVPSFNQAQYLPETLQSLVDQNYPVLEVIIQEAGSTDGSIAIAEDFVKRYPAIFKLFVEKDSGQADALNRGFARTTGEILAFLNSDDTYYPETLHRVAAELDPAKGRYIVMGRCLFTGEGSCYVGVEHPAEYINHFEHLAIWKRGFNTIPQPSVFWHRSVWERSGGLDINEHHALDYDLFSRFSKHYRFHRIDKLFSTYRMHDSSKSSQRTEAEVLELSIKVSQKHWGTWLAPLRWQCELSYWLYTRQLHERARHHARRAEEAFKARNFGVALVETAATFMASPQMARDRLFYGWLAAKGVRVFQRLAISKEGFSGRHPDGWIGPIYRQQISIPNEGKQLNVSATYHLQPTHKNIKVKLFINNRVVETCVLKKDATFSLTADLEPYRGQVIELELKTNSYFVPGDLDGGEDKRKLSLKLGNVVIDKI